MGDLFGNDQLSIINEQLKKLYLFDGHPVETRRYYLQLSIGSYELSIDN